MDIKQYEIIFTPTAINEIRKIYNYITKKLKSKKAADNLMNKIEEKVQNLKYAPRIYQIIKVDNQLELEYRKIVVNNYVIIYTIIENKNNIFISHVFYAGSSYLNKI